MHNQAAVTATSLLMLGAVGSANAPTATGDSDLAGCLAGAFIGAFMWSKQRDRGDLFERVSTFFAVFLSGACLAPILSHHAGVYLNTGGLAVSLPSGWISGLMAHSIATAVLETSRDKWLAWITDRIGGGKR